MTNKTENSHSHQLDKLSSLIVDKNTSKFFLTYICWRYREYSNKFIFFDHLTENFKKNPKDRKRITEFLILWIQQRFVLDFWSTNNRKKKKEIEREKEREREREKERERERELKKSIDSENKENENINNSNKCLEEFGEEELKRKLEKELENEKMEIEEKKRRNRKKSLMPKLVEFIIYLKNEREKIEYNGFSTAYTLSLHILKEFHHLPSPLKGPLQILTQKSTYLSSTSIPRSSSSLTVNLDSPSNSLSSYSTSSLPSLPISSSSSISSISSVSSISSPTIIPTPLSSSPPSSSSSSSSFSTRKLLRRNLISSTNTLNTSSSPSTTSTARLLLSKGSIGSLSRSTLRSSRSSRSSSFSSPLTLSLNITPLSSPRQYISTNPNDDDNNNNNNNEMIKPKPQIQSNNLPQILIQTYDSTSPPTTARSTTSTYSSSSSSSSSTSSYFISPTTSTSSITLSFNSTHSDYDEDSYSSSLSKYLHPNDFLLYHFHSSNSPITPWGREFLKKFNEVNVRNIVEEISYFEWRLFRSIKSKHLLDLDWKDDEITSSPVALLVQHFNNFGNWICSWILTTNKMDVRVQLIKRWILVAADCLEFGNYNTLMEIMAGLNLHPLARLHRLWERVPDKYKELKSRLEQVIEPRSNYKIYRERIKLSLESKNWTFPYLGLYLRDLLWIEEGNSTKIKEKEKEGEFNINKVELVEKLLTEFNQFRIRRASMMKATEGVYNFLKAIRSCCEADLDHLSLSMETLRTSTTSDSLYTQQ